MVSDRFTYEVAHDIGGDVLVLAAEDLTGASPPGRHERAVRGRLRSVRSATRATTVDTYDVDRMTGLRRTTSACFRTTTP